MTSFFGGVFGIDKAFRHDLRLGVFLGAGRTRQSTEVDVGSIDSDLAFGGVYGRHTFGASFLDVSLLGGYSRNASTRNINNNMIPGGLEYAKAAFDGWFISPEIAYGYRYAFNNEWSLTPAARLRYLATMLGGYTETGSTANLTVNARTLQNIEERGDLTLTRTITHSQTERIQTSATLGVLGVQRAGSSNVGAVLLGQNLAFAAPGSSSLTGVYGALGLDWRTRGGVSFFSGAEYTTMSDSSTTITGKGGVRVAF